MDWIVTPEGQHAAAPCKTQNLCNTRDVCKTKDQCDSRTPPCSSRCIAHGSECTADHICGGDHNGCTIRIGKAKAKAGKAKPKKSKKPSR